MEDEQRLQRRAQEVEQQGKSRFGDAEWANLVGAVGRARPSDEMIANSLASPNAVSEFAQAGKQVLLQEMSGGDANAERAYGEIRAREREQHRKLKGRG